MVWVPGSFAAEGGFPNFWGLAWEPNHQGNMGVTRTCISIFTVLETAGPVGGRGCPPGLPRLPTPLISAARSCPHLCGRTSGVGGPQGPQQEAAAPTPPRPAAATFRASASASARYREATGTGPGPTRRQTVGTPSQICTRSPAPTGRRPHLSRGVRAAKARRARFPQGATLGLRKEALAVQRGFDEACIAVKLHQVEDLRNRRRGGELEWALCEPPESQTRPWGLAASAT